jgi:hypothetical protein
MVGAVMVLPQGVAYATLAGMPPEYGLYGAMLLASTSRNRPASSPACATSRRISVRRIRACSRSACSRLAHP